MFQTKTPVAVLAGMVVAGSILLAPVVVAAPTGGVAVTWGANGWGQLGDNSTTYSKVPVVVDRSGVLAGKTVTAISAGDRRTCAVAARRAYCWGGNDLRELGLTVSVVPVAVDASGVLAGKTVTAITAGDYYTCAVADGQTFCWGRNKQQRRDEVEGAGSGEHRRAAAPYIGHRDRRRRRPHGSHRSADDFGSEAAHRDNWYQGGGQETSGEDHLETGDRRDVLPGADLQTGREEIQALEDHQHPGVQNQSPQRQEIPLPSRRSRSRWTRTGHHQTVQSQVVD